LKIDKTYLPLLFFSCVAIGIMLGGLLNFPSENQAFVKNDYKTKLNKLINFIDNEYVDEVKTDSIVDLTVTNILANLDPHSVYVTPEEQVAVSENMKGDFVGIGVTFYTFNDTVTVINPLKNGPADKAGILAGDRILFAGNNKLFGSKVTNKYIYDKLKGKINSEVNLRVFRKQGKRSLNFKVIRDIVPIKSVDIALKVDDNTGYIKINRFAESTATEFEEALKTLKKEKIANLIVDLRENGGGFMEMAIEIADQLLPKDDLIVFTKNRSNDIEKTFATNKGMFEKGRIAILIDENSASASEILAGAIQDNDRGLIFGRRSFGKGLVQREMTFDDGSAVRLTVARYYTPSGRSIQKAYKKGNQDAYFEEFDSRFENGELYEKDKIKIADSLKFKTKKGRTVYGGGGIVPDVFVPLEATQGQEGLEYILQSGILGRFVFEQLDANRTFFNSWQESNLSEKIQQKDYLNKFQNYLAKNGLETSLKANKNLVIRFISAEFGRQLFGEKTYYHILLQKDPMVLQVLKNQTDKK
jgi:carboxyl-terminal processing protease